MKTTTESIQRRRTAHHKALEVLAATVGCKTPGLTLWRGLRLIEAELYRACLNYTNGTNGVDEMKWRGAKQAAHNSLENLFGGPIPKGVFINGDPRGHMIKLDNETVTIPDGMEKDWGGYGILAAEIN
jgi:hypothetical protein